MFGDFTYDFTDMFSVSLGGRYTWDQRTSDVILRQIYLGGGGSPFFGGTGVPLVAATSNFTGTADFEEFTPRASVSFQPAEDQTIYASYSRGFKGGGFDPRGLSTACRNPTAAAPATPTRSSTSCRSIPETVTSYEIGYARRCSTAASASPSPVFHADYKDVQVPGSVGAVDQRRADLHRRHHQCRQGALPGRRVRGRLRSSRATSAPTATG